MGWAYGIGEGGRDIGYSVEAECDEPGCGKKIDRGLDYACGGEHGSDGVQLICAGYFCYDHLRGGWDGLARCHKCTKEHETIHPGCDCCWEAAAVGLDEDGHRTCGGPECSESERPLVNEQLPDDDADGEKR